MLHSKTRKMTYSAFAAALMAICAWISIPGPVPFTLQTFGLFITLGLLGGKLGTRTICVYLGLGILGLPVFSGFQGGIGVLMGATGGYITGFLAAGLVYWVLTKAGCSFLVAMGCGLVSCYAFGTAWYLVGFAPGTSLWWALSTCVLPFLIPDGLKLALCAMLIKRLRPYIHE